MFSPWHMTKLELQPASRNAVSERSRWVLRKDRVFETLRSMCTQRPAQSGALRRYPGFSAEEVAELAQVDRTNASRDLNILVQEGLIERIPGRPVLFTIRPSSTSSLSTSGHTEK